MERRVNVVAAPTKAPLDPSGGVGRELGKQAVLPGGSSYSRSLLAPMGRDTVAPIKSLDKPEPVKVRRSFGGFWILSRL